ncbi:MAG: hypothetical protein ACYDA1_10795 [Vulcanimicrobiaceae bacterium]
MIRLRERYVIIQVFNRCVRTLLLSTSAIIILTAITSLILIGLALLPLDAYSGLATSTDAHYCASRHDNYESLMETNVYERRTSLTPGTPSTPCLYLIGRSRAEKLKPPPLLVRLSNLRPVAAAIIVHASKLIGLAKPAAEMFSSVTNKT